MTLILLLLIILIVIAVWTVRSRSLLKSAIGLAILSAILTIFMFLFNSPLAAVFELSVCAGLITVIFLSTIGLVKPLSNPELDKLVKEKHKRYKFLPLFVVTMGVAALCLTLPVGLVFVQKVSGLDVRQVLWNTRQLDLVGQIIILLAGGFGAVILFKEKRNNA